MQDVKWSDAREDLYTPEEKKIADRLIKLHVLHNGILELQEELLQNPNDAEVGCLDYKKVKALAATYELQDYLANEYAVQAQLAAQLVGGDVDLIDPEQWQPAKTAEEAWEEFKKYYMPELQEE